MIRAPAFVLLCSMTFGPRLIADDGAPPSAPDAVNQFLLEEIRLLRKSIEKLETRIASLEATIAKLRPPETDADSDDAPEEATPDADIPPSIRKLLEGKIPPSLRGRLGATFRRDGGADRAALAKIRLPADPTRDQVAEYIREICAVSRGQRTFSSEDPQPSMLVRIGAEHLDLLLDNYQTGLSFYFNSVIERLARDEDKKLIIDALRVHRALVDVISKRRWEADAREVLVAELERRPSYLPPEWIWCVVRLKDPSTREALLDYFRHGPNKSFTYEALRTISSMDLDEVVAEVWSNRTTDSGGPFSLPSSTERLASIAMAHGHLDAAAEVFEGLADAGEWERRKLREAIYRHTAARGSDDELLEWFAKHRDRLAWDTIARKFVVVPESR